MHAKIMGLLAATAIVAMALAASAAATTLTTNEGETATFIANAEEHVNLHNPHSNVFCGSTISGTVSSHGEGKKVVTPLSTMTFTGCTNSWHVTTASAGQTTVEYVNPGEGTLYSDGVTVEATRFGAACRYATNNTHIGTITDSSKTGGKATLDIQGSIPFHSGSVLCGTSPTAWTGSYIVDSPTTVHIHP